MSNSTTHMYILIREIYLFQIDLFLLKSGLHLPCNSDITIEISAFNG